MEYGTNYTCDHGEPWGDCPQGCTNPPEPVDEAAEYWASRTVAGGSFVLDAPDIPARVWGDDKVILWAQGESLMICGPAGVGKTTIAQQLVAARIGVGTGEVLGMPVAGGSRRVLYLAMDRPPQIARAMGRLFTGEHRETLDARLIVWKGPPPYDLAKRPEVLLEMCEHAGADTVVIDSLKDGVLKLSDDEAGGGYNKARQRALVAGVEIIELHHQRKASGDNKKPSKLDDVYGSTWITAGAGSVLSLWGESGDPIVELTHLKQPMEPFGPVLVIHNHTTGRTDIHHETDLLSLTRLQGRVGMNAKLAATRLFGTEKPTASQVEKARRKLAGLVEAGHLVVLDSSGGRGNPSTYFLAEPDPDASGKLTNKLTQDHRSGKSRTPHETHAPDETAGQKLTDKPTDIPHPKLTPGGSSIRTPAREVPWSDPLDELARDLEGLAS